MKEAIGLSIYELIRAVEDSVDIINRVARHQV